MDYSKNNGVFQMLAYTDLITTTIIVAAAAPAVEITDFLLF